MDNIVCRICGQVSETYHLIFDQNGPQIADKIRKCLKIELFRDDCKPKQLCDMCLMKLNDFSHFIDMFNAIDRKFESMWLREQRPHHLLWPPNNTIIDDYNATSAAQQSVIVTPNIVLDTAPVVDIIDDLYANSNKLNSNGRQGEMLLVHQHAGESQLQGQYTTAANDNNINYLNNPSNSNDFYQSDITAETTTTVLRRHSSNYHQHPSDNSGSSSSSNNYHNQSIISKTRKDLLLAPPPPPPSILPDYNIDASSHYNSGDNQKICIISIETLQPSKPSASDTNNTIIDKTATIVKTKKVFQCPHCDRSLQRRVTLNAHIAAIHTNIRPYTCDTCNKSFVIKCHLTNHQKVHTGSFRCTYCPSSFTTPSKLLRHSRTHTKERPFACRHINCTRSFSDKRNLDAHQVVHSNEYKCRCNVCGKRFKSSKGLRWHEKWVHAAVVTTQTVRAIHTCDVCSKRYKYKSTLIAHMRKHNGYFCPNCNQDCKRAVKLIKHRKACRMEYCLNK